MAKHNTYREQERYEIGGFPTCGRHGSRYFSTRNDDTEIRIEKRLAGVSDPAILIEKVREFGRTHSEVKLNVQTQYGVKDRDAGLWLMGWRKTTADERDRIEKMKERRKKKVAKEKKERKELERKHQEKIAQQEAEKIARQMGGEDRLIAEAIKVLKKRGVKVTIES